MSKNAFAVRLTSTPNFPEDDSYEISDFTMQTCAETLRTFVSTERVDVLEHMTRAQYRSFYGERYQHATNDSLKAAFLAKLKLLNANPKNVPEHNLSTHIDDPFKLLGLDTKSEVQSLIEQVEPLMKFRGNYAYKCSCGSGKTLAGINLMYLKQCKTMIISSRNAINDQWLSILLTLYPKLIIRTLDGLFINGSFAIARNSVKIETIEPDVWIYSPQYLVKQLNKHAARRINNHPALNPSLIIYDEVHSLTSDQFVHSITFPYKWVQEGIYDELPYMISLSATYPSESTLVGKKYSSRIKKIFGEPITAGTNITNTPVKFWDYRDHYSRTNEFGNILTGEAARGNFDMQFRCKSDTEAVVYFMQKIDTEKRIVPSEQYKGIVMTSTIDASVFAALYIHRLWNRNILCIREHDAPSLFLPKDEYLDYNFDNHISIDTIDRNVGIWTKDFAKYIPQSCVIVGTIARLKEGFSVQNVVWGICTKFIYNTIPRVQILGRIRRSSTDPDLNAHERLFYVNSCRVPSTMSNPHHKTRHEIRYDFSFENAIFEAENYVRI